MVILASVYSSNSSVPALKWYGICLRLQPDYIEREDGFDLLTSTYGLKLKDVKDIDIGLKYQALEKGDIDVTNGFTTDAQLGGDTVVVLEDDKHLQVNYYCSTVESDIKGF